MLLSTSRSALTRILTLWMALLMAVTVAPAHAADHDHHHNHPVAVMDTGDGTILVLIGDTTGGHSTPSDAVLERAAAALVEPAATHTPTGPAGYATSGHYHIDFQAGIPEAVKSAFIASVDAFTAPLHLNPATPIRIAVGWEPEPLPQLAYGGGQWTVGPDRKTLMPTALIEQVTGNSTGRNTMFIRFNSAVDWHLDPATPAADRHDFRTVSLHELAHAFGFIDMSQVWEHSAWTQYLHRTPTPAFDIGGGLLHQLDDGWYDGAPDHSHFAQAAYPYPAPGWYMTPELSAGNRALCLDAPVIGVLSQIGWTITAPLAVAAPKEVTVAGTTATITWEHGLHLFAQPAHHYQVEVFDQHGQNRLGHSTVTGNHSSAAVTIPAGHTAATVQTVITSLDQNGATRTNGTSCTPTFQPAPDPEPASSQELPDQIGRLFHAFFGRDPDPAGHRWWMLERAKRVPLDTIADEFAVSPEFINTYGSLSNTEFVQLVYRNVLDRPADTAGLNHWVEVLNRGGSRGTVMTGFSESAEYIHRTKTVPPSPAPVGAVSRLYLAFFTRTPDTGGLIHWVTHLRNGGTLQQTADEFAVSPEFINTYGSLSNTEFVQLVYRNVLDRPADTAGLNHWVEVLNRGGSRGTVMTGFSESAEYILRTGTLP